MSSQLLPACRELKVTQVKGKAMLSEHQPWGQEERWRGGNVQEGPISWKASSLSCRANYIQDSLIPGEHDVSSKRTAVNCGFPFYALMPRILTDSFDAKATALMLEPGSSSASVPSSVISFISCLKHEHTSIEFCSCSY